MHDKELVQLAIESIRYHDSLDTFWEHVHQLQLSGELRRTDAAITRVLRMNDAVIFRTGKQLRDKDLSRASTSRTPINEPDWPYECIEQNTDMPVRRSIAIALAKMFDSGTILPELSPSALERSGELVKDISLKYGWLRKDDAFVHYRLGLVLFPKSLRLVVMDSGMPRPCLQVGRFEDFSKNRNDLVASVMVTCVTDEAMADHITRFSPGFKEKWLEYKERR